MADFGYARPQRQIGGIIPDVTIEEQAQDELTITEFPVEVGAPISDHAYKNPVTLTMRVGWSNSSVQGGGDPGYIDAVYQQLLTLQATRQPLEIVTGRRDYSNMLIRGLALTNDQTTEQALFITATLREVIVAETTATTIAPAGDQAEPQKTGAVENTGPKQLQPGTGFTPSAGG